MANTIIIYQGDGTTTSFTVPFDYLKKTFVKVFFNTSTELKGGTSSDTSADYYFADNSTIKLRSIVPTTSQTITIRRYTSVTERVASFRDGSVLYAKDLDTSQVQAFHIAEEARDILNDALTVDRLGNWDAKNKRIINVGTPTESTDSATKGYVDTVFGVQKTLEEYLNIGLGYRNETEEFAKDAESNATIAQDSADTALSAKEATDVNLEAVKALANTVASDKATVASDKEIVASDKATVREMVTYIEDVSPHKEDIETVVENIDSIVGVAPHTDDIVAINAHIDEVHTVGQDLQGINADSLDLGSVTEAIDQITTVTDGYIKKVAEHIDDCVHPVSLHLDAIEAVAGEISSIASKLSLTGGTMTGDITMSGNRQITSETSGGGRVYIGTTSLSLESNNTGYENGAGLLLRSSTYANDQKGHFYLYAGTSSSNRITLEGNPDTEKLTWGGKEVLTGEISASQLADTIDLGSM